MAVVCLMIQNLVSKYVPETEIIAPMLNSTTELTPENEALFKPYFVLGEVYYILSK